MNVYECDAGEHDLAEDYVDMPEGSRLLRFSGRVWAMVIAPTRGRAKKLFMQWALTWDGGKVELEWTDKMSIKVQHKDIGDVPEGVNDYDQLVALGLIEPDEEYNELMS